MEQTRDEFCHHSTISSSAFVFFLIKFVDVFVHICMINFHFTIKQFSSFSQYFPYVPLHAVDASARKEITVCEKTFDNSALYWKRILFLWWCTLFGRWTWKFRNFWSSSFQFLIFLYTLSVINNVSKKQIILVWHLEPH